MTAVMDAPTVVARLPERFPDPPASPERAPRERWRQALIERLPGTAIVLGALALVVPALAAGLRRFPPLNDDEGTYVAQAWAFRTRGALAHYTYWYDHPPLGWIQLAALEVIGRPVRWVFGSTGSAVLDARRLMLLPAIASTVLVYLLARRLGVSRLFAGLAMLAFGLSPLTVAMERAIYLDALALPWVLAAAVLVLSPRTHLWSFASGGACLAVAVLSKETMLLVLPALVFSVWRRSDRRTRPFCAAGFALPFALLALGYPLYALLKGELLPGAGHVSLLEAIRFQLGGRPSTGSALVAGTGSHRVVADWLTVDPWLIALGLASLPFALWSRRLRPAGIALACLVVVGLRPGYLPTPYVIALLPYCAVCVSAAADAAARAIVTGLRHHADAIRARLIVVRAGAAILAAVAVIAVGLLGSTWADRRRSHDEWNANASTLATERWVASNIDHRARVLVDDTYFVDLVDRGFDPDLGVVWFYKLDFSTNLDPSVTRALPRGLQEFDYVISSPVIRSAVERNPAMLGKVRQALVSSVVVQSFGSGSDRVEVRRIEGAGSGRMRSARAV